MKVVRGPGQKLLITLTHVLISSFQMNMYRHFPVSASKRVGTHNGSFHCDEALACFILRQIHRLAAAEVIRTRDHQVPLSFSLSLSRRSSVVHMLYLKLLEAVDAVVDVGGVYDPTRDRFDHHQKGFDQVFGHGFTTKLSSAGLVYKAVDAVDNGINQYDTDQPPRYVNNTSLAARVGRLNLDWMDSDQSSERENEAFQRAMMLAGGELLESIRFHAKSWLPARSIMMECLAARNDVDSSGEIMVLTRSCPWKLHIFEIEEEMKIDPSVKYVNYQDDRSGNWRLQEVAVSPDKFEGRNLYQFFGGDWKVKNSPM